MKHVSSSIETGFQYWYGQGCLSLSQISLSYSLSYLSISYLCHGLITVLDPYLI